MIRPWDMGRIHTWERESPLSPALECELQLWLQTKYRKRKRIDLRDRALHMARKLEEKGVQAFTSGKRKQRINWTALEKEALA